jgi:hypothetical protein
LTGGGLRRGLLYAVCGIVGGIGGGLVFAYAVVGLETLVTRIDPPEADAVIEKLEAGQVRGVTNSVFGPVDVTYEIAVEQCRLTVKRTIHRDPCIFGAVARGQSEADLSRLRSAEVSEIRGRTFVALRSRDRRTEPPPVEETSVRCDGATFRGSYRDFLFVFSTAAEVTEGDRAALERYLRFSIRECRR